jgi:diguanylate cyclase (GGDEF)-like protein
MLRQEDLFCRWGGEEFAALLPATGREEALKAAERIRREIARAPLHFNHDSIEVTVSLGVESGVPGPKDDPAKMISAADAALYRAKNSGRNRVVPAGE